MTEDTGDVLIEATFQGKTCFIIDKDYWHLTHLKSLLVNNVRVGHGFSWSVSAMNLADNLGSAVTPYGLNARFSDKEADWERIRKTEFSSLPTRVNALFLFDSKELAQKATADPHWFGNENRHLVRAQLVDGCRVFRADTKWLDGATPDNLADRAKKYWSGEMTTDAMPEIIVCGLAFFPDWQYWAREESSND